MTITDLQHVSDLIARDAERKAIAPLPYSRCSLCWANVEHSFDAHRIELGMPAASEVRP